MYKNNYEDIIHLPYLKSEKHPPMSKAERAAQFLPFAALTGYDDEIKETARLTDTRITLSEDALLSLNMRLAFLSANLEKRLTVDILYFKEDELKAGGSYIHAKGSVKKIDDIEHLIIMNDQKQIPIHDIIDINIESLDESFD